MSILLPWPPAQLSPNARIHWAKKSKHAKSYRTACFLAFCASHQVRGKSSFKFTFHPPDHRRRDIDNMLASSKQLIDALSEVSGIDDSKFKFQIEKGEPMRGGGVIVEVLD